MELIVQKMNQSEEKNKSNLQITLDDDFNVPDMKPDIDKIVKEQGTILIQEITPMTDRFVIKGVLDFNLLYISQESKRPVHNMNGQIPFEESVNMEGITGEESILPKWELEDMSVSLINTRKVNVRAIISFDFSAETGEEQKVITGVEEGENVEYQTEKIYMTQPVLSKKDTYRIKDEITLPMGKDNIREILYSGIDLLEVETRLQEERVSLRALLRIFVLYMGENENRGMEYYETELPISGTIDCSGSREEMISDIFVEITGRDVAVKPDEDGEERVLDLEAVLSLSIKAYEEKEMELLKDLYSIKNQVNIVRKQVPYKTLLMKNNSKLRVVDTLKLEEGQKTILQICNGSGAVKIDDAGVVENGIQVEGIISVQILYITEEDEKPVGALRGDIPFNQIIEVKDMKKNSIYEIRPCLDQIGMTLMDENEIEVKATICLEAMVFDENIQEVILSVEEGESLDPLRQKLPSMVGYFVRSGDSLWNIAKKFYTTRKAIKDLNGLEGDLLTEGQKLLISKC
ncbi:MAG: DUF3794 domain-containing protein [Acetivibrio sp.]